MPWSIGQRLSLVGMITLGINYGTRNTFGLFLRPLAEEFGSTRGLISLTLGVNFLVYGIVIFGVGWLIDRFGPRVVMVWGMIIGTLAWWATSMAFSPLFMVVTFGIVFGLATAMLSQVTSTSLIGKYVAQGAGPFLGYIGMGPGVGHFIFTPILSALIVFFSWRWAMAMVGFLFLSSLLLPGTALRGLQPLATGRDSQNRGTSLSGCLPMIRQKSFALLFAAFFCLALGAYLYITQIAACAEDRGLGPATAAMALGTLSGTGVLISPIVGWTTNRLGRYRLAGVLIFLLAGAGMVFTRFSNHLFLSSVLVGIGYGGYVPVLPAMAMRIYPRILFGRIWGLITVGGCLGAALGSWTGGLIYDWAGDYDYAWWLAAVAFAWAAACLLAIPEDRGEGDS
jgi:MFS family permease